MEQLATGAYSIWGLQEEIRQLKVAQYETAETLLQHSERIGKLEKQHDDSGIRSLWSTSSPFPDLINNFAQRTHVPPTPPHSGSTSDPLLLPLLLPLLQVTYIPHGLQLTRSLILSIQNQPILCAKATPSLTNSKTSGCQGCRSTMSTSREGGLREQTAYGSILPQPITGSRTRRPPAITWDSVPVPTALAAMQ